MFKEYRPGRQSRTTFNKITKEWILIGFECQVLGTIVTAGNILLLIVFYTWKQEVPTGTLRDYWMKASDANIDWWLVRNTLLMELGMLRDFLGNFSMHGERYYFHMEGSMWVGCNVRIPHLRWKWSCKVTFQGGGGDPIWHACEVGMVMQGGCKVRIPMWGWNGHARWLFRA